MNKHLQNFYNAICLADIAPIFSNYTRTDERDKEITESMAMLDAAINYSGFDKKDNSVQVFVVGDGKRPRTGILFAYFTSWNVRSIDPLMDYNWWDHYYEFKAKEGQIPKRIKVYNSMIEDYEFPHRVLDYESNNKLLILPHSHASMETCLDKLGTCTVINMPCCKKFPDKLQSREAVAQYGYTNFMDFDVLSAKKTIHIWKGLNIKGYNELTKKRKK